MLRFSLVLLFQFEYNAIDEMKGASVGICICVVYPYHPELCQGLCTTSTGYWIV